MKAIVASACGALVAVASFVARAGDLPAVPTEAGTAPAQASPLTVGGEVRLRYAALRNARLVPGNDAAQTQFRGLVHAGYRVSPRFRMYGEIGTGQVDRDRDTSNAALQNRASLQQLYVDVDTGADGAGTLFGATLGRQEFAEGPRQLVSAGDGANLRRTWNGARAYAKAAGYKVTVFELRATHLGAGAFDETVRGDTVLRGLVADITLAHGGPGTGGDASLQPFWLHTTMQTTSTGAGSADVRNTFGARLTGSCGAMRWDWTLARQQGDAGARDVHAWGLFAVQSLALSDAAWKPRLTSHVDVASRDFNPLYASSSYLGEGQFLALANLLLVAPGIAVSPTRQTTLSLEVGHARRMDDHAAVLAGGLRPYSGTADSRGRHIGNLTRFSAGWNASSHLTLVFSAEHLATGAVLDQAGLSGSTYVQVGASLRY